jgi:glucan phosphoethanolaminetransferase (alkaline phosphatase superfamily)
LINLILADALLLLHVLVVVFIVFGLVAIYAGWTLAWSWVRNPWFRLLHVVAICIVALQSWAGVICPLTIWEMSLRNQAGDTVYSGTFISYWLETLLYYQAPAWVFMVAYTTFAALVIASWFIVRPRLFGDS